MTDATLTSPDTLSLREKTVIMLCVEGVEGCPGGPARIFRTGARFCPSCDARSEALNAPVDPDVEYMADRFTLSGQPQLATWYRGNAYRFKRGSQ